MPFQLFYSKFMLVLRHRVETKTRVFSFIKFVCLYKLKRVTIGNSVISLSLRKITAEAHAIFQSEPKLLWEGLFTVGQRANQ